MPFTWPITINKGPSRAVFDPHSLTGVQVGDQIFWTNADPQAHWPGRKMPDGSIDKTYFMQNQIPAHSTSTTFAPGAAGSIEYCCSLHPQETGSIIVG